MKKIIIRISGVGYDNEYLMEVDDGSTDDEIDKIIQEEFKGNVEWDLIRC